MSETGLVARVESLAEAAVEDAAVLAALEDARYALSVVVHDAATAEQATQVTLKITRARKDLAARKKPFASALRDAAQTLAAIFFPVERELESASAYLDNQLKEYALAQRREQERKAREAEANRIEAERKAREAAAAGKPVPPPRTVYVPPTPEPVRTDAGTVSLRWDLRCEMVNPNDCDPAWLVLDTQQALAYGRAHAAAEGLEKKEGHSVTLRGVRYWYEPSTHKSGR